MPEEQVAPQFTPEELARYARWEPGVQNGGEPVTSTEEPADEPETPVEEADEAADDEAVEEEGEETPHKKKSGVQRLKEKLRVSEEARIRAEERAAVLEETRKTPAEPTPAKPAASPDRPAKPDLDTFEGTQAEYLEARDAWLLGEFEAKQEAKATAAKAKEQTQTRQQAWDAQVLAAKTRLPDLDKVLNVPFATPVMQDALLDTENGVDVAHHLATHLDEAKTIAALGPVAQVLAIGKLAVRFAPVTAPPPKKTTEAPPPPSPVGARGSSNVDTSKMTDQEWLEHHRKNRSGR
jgi:hypothetical protein